MQARGARCREAVGPAAALRVRPALARHPLSPMAAGHFHTLR
jgi:hypothetical protein